MVIAIGQKEKSHQEKVARQFTSAPGTTLGIERKKGKTQTKSANESIETVH